jgi:hypothetical protein
MPGSGPLDYLSLWGFFGATVVIVLLSIEGGYRLGRFRRRNSEEEKEAPVGAVVAATLGLLAFILAFTFGLAASRFDDRRKIVVEEANAVGTTYLRTGLLPDADVDRRVKLRRLLREYVDERLEVIESGNVEHVLTRTAELHRDLWKETELLGRQYPNSIAVGLLIQSMNETIDVHSKRVLVGLQNRLPAVIWGVLYLITLLTMIGVGYHAGLSKSRRSPAIVVLVLAFSAILTLVADLDRSREGLLTVSQRAMIDLRESMNDAP